MKGRLTLIATSVAAFAIPVAAAEASVGDDALSSMVMVEGSRDQASGFALEDGHRVVTTADVTRGESRVTLTLGDGTAFGGEVLAADESADIAVLRSEQSLPALEKAETEPAASGSLTAVVSPLADGPSSDETVVSDAAGAASLRTRLDLDNAAGGPLLDGDGAVTGIAGAQAKGETVVAPVDAVAALERREGLTTAFDPPPGRGWLPFALLLGGIAALGLVALLLLGQRHSGSLLARRPRAAGTSMSRSGDVRRDDVVVVLKSADR